MSRITGGPVVRDDLETNIPGIFACGNVLHVHDLVDYVSEEAEKAGRSAAAFIRGGCPERTEAPVQIKAENGVRYTVPFSLDPEEAEELLKVRFRVSAVFKDAYVSVYFNDERVMHTKKRILSPGEMEQIILQKKKLLECRDLKTITVRIEDE